MRLEKISLHVGIILCAALLLATFLAPVLAPGDPYELNMKNRLLPPGSVSPDGRSFPLGTDHLGRCLLSRLLFGARTSLGIAFMVIAVTFFIGVVVGVISGLFSSTAVDRALTGICEIVLAFPGILLALVLSAVLGPGIENIMLAVALVSWAKYARLVRSLTIGIKGSDYIRAARVSGTRTALIVIRHILPNMMNTIITVLVSDIGSTILRIAGLSFIGLGAQPPEAEWGMMINEARLYMSSAPHLIIFPVAAISVTVLIFNLIGDGLQGRAAGQSW